MAEDSTPEETEPEERAVRVGDDILLRLQEGRRPIEYPDTQTRIAYQSGEAVEHAGTVWAMGYLDADTAALELEDGTLVAIDDIDLQSIVITHRPAADPDEEDES